MYQTRGSVSSDIQRLRSWLKNEVFLFLMKHSFKCLILLLKAFIILGENQSKTSLNFMIIRITYSNLLHGSDFFCFLFMNY